MLELGVYNFAIERKQFSQLERALSIALPAARSLGTDAGIFWIRDSIFAATPYASIGIANPDLELRCDRKVEGRLNDCVAISQFAARKILKELRPRTVQRIEKIGLVFLHRCIAFLFEYARESGSMPLLVFLSYLDSWRPRMTPREHCELLATSCPHPGRTLSIEDLRLELRRKGDYGYVLFEDFSNIVVSRSFLLAFLEVAKDENTTFYFSYYDEQRFVVFRAGDVIAILSVID